MATDYYVFLRAHTIVAGTKDEIKYGTPGAEATDTIAPETYFLRGDDDTTSGAYDLKAGLLDVLSFGSLNSVSVAFDVDPDNVACAVTLDASANSSLDFDATDNIDLPILGHPAGAQVDDDVSNNIISSITSTLAWVPDEPPAADDPIFVSNIAQTRTVGGQVRTADLGGPYDDRRISFTMLSPKRVLAASNSADPNATFEVFWEAIRGGSQFEVHKVTISSGSVLGALTSSTRVGTYVLGANSARQFVPQRHSPGVELYSFSLDLLEYAA